MFERPQVMDRRCLSCLGAIFLGVGFVSEGAADDQQLAIFGGVHVAQNWEDVFADPANIEWRDSVLFGAAYGREWDTRFPAASLGFELQGSIHAGEQDHFEFNLPAFLRLQPPDLVPVRSFGFGLGLSYATKVPLVEVERKGQSQQLLFYWAIEAEFGPKDGVRSTFVRLHHRSDGFGFFETDTGSNFLVVGLRRRW